MSLIHWMPENNTYIDDIDNQHRQLVTLMNDLETAIDNFSNKTNALKIIKKIFTYSSSHFAREEHMMDTNKFPELEFHRNEHFVFEDMVFDIEDAVTNEDMTLAQKKLVFLSDWFVDHMRKADQEYLPYLKPKDQTSQKKQNAKPKLYRGQNVSSEKTEGKQQHSVTYRGQKAEQDNPTPINKTIKKAVLYRGQKI